MIQISLVFRVPTRYIASGLRYHSAGHVTGVLRYIGRIYIKLQLTGKSRLILQFYRYIRTSGLTTCLEPMYLDWCPSISSDHISWRKFVRITEKHVPLISKIQFTFSKQLHLYILTGNVPSFICMHSFKIFILIPRRNF